MTASGDVAPVTPGSGWEEQEIRARYCPVAGDYSQAFVAASRTRDEQGEFQWPRIAAVSIPDRPAPVSSSPSNDGPSPAVATASVFEQIGGEAGVRALVDAFYDGMDREPAYAGIRALHPPDLAGSRDKLFWFLCGWTGGPDHFVQRFGHPRLRARHLPFPIGVSERDQWLACMQQAMTGRGIDGPLRQRLGGAFQQTADWMRNQAG